MKESGERLGVSERIEIGSSVIKDYSKALKIRLKREVVFRKDKSKAKRSVDSAKKAGLEGLDTTPAQREFIDATDENSATLKKFNPEDADSLDEFLENFDPNQTPTTESLAVLSRRLELSLDREEATIIQIRKGEKELRRLAIETLRKLLK